MFYSALNDLQPGLSGRQVLDYWLGPVTGRGFTRANATAALHHYNWMIECLKASPDGLRARATEWAERRRKLPAGAAALFEVFEQYDADLRRDEARFRAAVMALAAEHFRRSEGRWPATPDELVPRHLDAVPRDPFDLRPLKLASRPDGRVVYAVGADGKDDGGAVEAEDPRKASDVGLRLWNVERRRQPPPAPKPTSRSP
jgi:hypothetical protein